MGNYENLKQSITEVIRTNGNQEITGAVLQSTLLTIISTVGANATFAGIATPTTNPGTPDGHVFYLASEGGTYTNFNAIELQDGLSVLTWNGSWSSQQIFSIDDEPTAGSDNLVKSGGVFNNIGAIDISELNATENPHTLATYEDLAYALNALPTSYRKGGMSVKFVQSSNNKYVQYRLMSDTFNTIEANWQESDNIPHIHFEERVLECDEINITDDEDNTVATIGKNYTNFKNLRSNGVDILSEIAKKNDKINVRTGETPFTISEQEWCNDDYTETYAKIGSYGIKAKAFLDLQGNPIHSYSCLAFLKNRKIGAIGDSITYGQYSSINFIEELANMTEMVVCNKAVPGATLLQIYSQIDLLDSNCDIIFVMGGTNNYRAGSNIEKTIGDSIINTEDIIDSTMKTYHGYLNTSDDTISSVLNRILIKLREKFPKSYIILANPPKSRAGYDRSSVSLSEVSTYERFRLLELKNAIREAALLHSVKFVDISSDVQINSQILQSEQIFYTHPAIEPYGNNVDGFDRSHPTELGHKMIAKHLYDVLVNNATQIEFLINISQN